MNHYPRHIGDIVSATVGLSLAERGAYTALIDQYYAREKPLPCDRKEVYRLAAANGAAERKAVDYVLSRFFVEEADGWHQKRCDEELARYHEKAAKASASASARWSGRNANASPDAMRTHSEGNASHKPVASSQEPVSKANPAASPPPDPWKVGKEFLISRGVPVSQAGSIIGKWAKQAGQPATVKALQAAIDGKVAEPVAYITAALQDRPSGKFDPVAYNARTA